MSTVSPNTQSDKNAPQKGRDNGVLPSKERLWSRMFIIITVCAFCTYIVGQGLNSGVPVYLHEIGEPSVLAGIMSVAFSAPAAFSRFFIGLIVDSRGRRKVILCGGCILLCGTALPLLSSSIMLLALARILQGIGFSFVTTAAATAAVDVLPKTRLGEGVGYFGLAQSCAFAFGPALALFLVTLEPSTIMFAGVSGIAAFVVLFSCLITYEKNPQHIPHGSTYWQRFHKGEVAYAKPADWNEGNHKTAKEEARAESSVKAELPYVSVKPSENQVHKSSTPHAKQEIRGKHFLEKYFDKNALPGAIPMLVLSPVFGFGICFIGLYGTSISIAVPGLFFSVNAIAMIAVRATSGLYMDIVSPMRLYTVAIVSGMLAYALLIGASTVGILYYVAGIFYGICLGLAFPILSTIAVKKTKPEHWGIANSMLGIATDIGIGFSTVVWGLLNDAFGFVVTLYVVLLLFLVAFFVGKKMFGK